MGFQGHAVRSMAFPIIPHGHTSKFPLPTNIVIIGEYGRRGKPITLSDSIFFNSINPITKLASGFTFNALSPETRVTAKTVIPAGGGVVGHELMPAKEELVAIVDVTKVTRQREPPPPPKMIKMSPPFVMRRAMDILEMYTPTGWTIPHIAPECLRGRYFQAAVTGVFDGTYQVVSEEGPAGPGEDLGTVIGALLVAILCQPSYM